jgi:hypothetical protein
MMLIRFQDAPARYDPRDQVELRRQIAQALSVASTAPAVDTSGIELRLAIAENTLRLIVEALAGEGIVVVLPGVPDFSTEDASGLLALYSIGGL